MSQNLKLEHLFKRCDTRGTGFIDQKEFRDLCRGFEIENNDADIIFDDLDHDGDGRISFNDFAFGFRDFLTPGARRGSIQLGLTSPSTPAGMVSRQPSFRYSNDDADDGLPEEFDVETQEKQRVMEKKHQEAKEAWKNFADHLGKEDVKKFLSVSSDKIFTLYEELQTSDAPAHLVSQYEDVISALMTDVKKMENETKKMEEKFARERETHTQHLKNIEAELDAQVARVESAVQERARKAHEEEKRDLQSKMELEMAQLQSQLKIFQKIDTYLHKEKDEEHTKEAQKKLDNAIDENRNLKHNLSQTQTNIAMLRAELNQMKGQYDMKVNELNEERENKIEFVYEFDNLNRQLELLKDANQQLQDTNDGLRTVVDIGSIHSPRVGRHEFSTLLAPDIIRSPSDNELAEKLYYPLKRKKKRGVFSTGSRSPSDNGGGSAYDSDSMRSRCSDRPRVTDAHFGLKRLMDDLDSGHSTLPPAEDYYPDSEANPKSLDYETREAIRRLDSVVGRSPEISPGETPVASLRQRPPSSCSRGPLPAFEQQGELDRDMEEVSRAAEDAVGEGGEGNGDNKNRLDVTDHSFSPNPSNPEANERYEQQKRVSNAAAPSEQKKSSIVPEQKPSISSDLKGAIIRQSGDTEERRPSMDIARPLSAKSSLQENLNYRDLEPTGPPDRTYKVVFAGDAAVGKTSFINRLTKGVFLGNLSSTLGVDFQVKTIRVDERNIAIQLWDTAGQERFRSVTRSYFRRADGVMLLYDVTSDRSYLSVRQWIEAVDDVSEKRIPIMLCANKVDIRAEALANGRKCITSDDGERMAREHSAIFIETSAKDGKNVIDALVQLSRDMCASEDVEVQTSALKIRDEVEKKSNCCSR